MTSTTYEFSAFTEADLLAAGAEGSSVSCGDTFTMSGTATTCFEVTDNDAFLSGDNCHNENANDQYGQQAAITDAATGAEIGNGGQIYAEKYFWVSDDAGNWYVMLQIEQEGTGEEYFTFFNGYGYETPTEGTNLTVYSSCNVTSDWVDYKCLDAGEKGPDTGSISGRVFCDDDCDGIDGGVTVIEGSDYTVEAEDMDAWGFKTVYGEHASGGELVRLQCAGQSAAIKTDFQGKDGVYDISLFIQDENDGASKIKLLVNGQVVEAIRLDRQSDGAGSNNGGFSEFVIEGVELKAGDEVKLWAEGNGYEFVRIDKIEFNGRDEEIRTEEQGKEGVIVVLLDTDGNEVLDENGQRIETATDDNGEYTFDGVPVGDYRVKFENPDGTEFTSQNAGSDDTIDSDVDGNGVSDVVSVVADQTTSDVDAGLKPAAPQPGSLSGTYFCDDNRDGDDDGAVVGDADIVSKTVMLFEADGVTPARDIDGNLVAAAVTDANGDYSFANLAAASYVVMFEATDGKSFIVANAAADDVDSDVVDAVNGKTAPVAVVAGEETTDVDAGVSADLGSLSGRYFCDTDGDNQDNKNGDEPGVEGVLVTLLNGDGSSTGRTATTDSDGNYSFGDLEAGTYGVTFNDPDGVLDGKVLVDPNVGDDASDSDAIGDTTSSTITGIGVAAGLDTPDNDAGVVEPGSLSGRYFCDNDGNGLDDDADDGGEGQGVVGVRVDLLDTNGQPTGDFTTTGPNGAYSFANLSPGSYGVRFATGVLDKVLTTQNVDNDDSDDIDSDAMADNVGFAVITNITVFPNQNTADNDIGVTSDNTDPEAEDVQAAVCADDMATINLLAAVSDPDGNAVSIISISDANETAGVGESIMLEGGGVAMLNADGTVSFDPNGAYDNLVIRDSAMDQFQFTATDSNGGTDTAMANIKVKGALNTIETIAEGFIDANGDPLQASYRVDFDPSGDGLSFPNTVTATAPLDPRLEAILGPDGVEIFDDNFAYCIDKEGLLELGVDVPSSLYIVGTDAMNTANGAIADAVDQEENLDIVTWILNQGFQEIDAGTLDDGDLNTAGTTGENYTFFEVQDAIWFFTDGDAVPPTATGVNSQEIIDLAMVAGEGFEAGEGDLVAVLFDPLDEDRQTYMVGVEFETLQEDCDCIL